MNHHKRDILTLFTVILMILISGGCAGAIYPFFTSLFGTFSVVITAAAFFLIHGIISAVYIRLIRHFLPLAQGDYDQSHMQFFLWKHYQMVGRMGIGSMAFFIPFFIKPLLYKMYGMTGGASITIAGKITDPCLVTIGDRAIIGEDARIVSHAIVSNRFIQAPVVIEQEATIGMDATLMPGVTVGKGAVVAPGSVVVRDTTIPPGEFWGGIPAKRVKTYSVKTAAPMPRKKLVSA